MQFETLRRRIDLPRLDLRATEEVKADSDVADSEDSEDSAVGLEDVGVKVVSDSVSADEYK